MSLQLNLPLRNKRFVKSLFFADVFVKEIIGFFVYGNRKINFYAEKDKADFISLFTDAAVMKHVGDGVLTREQAEAFWQKLFEKLYPQNYKIWAVFAKENSRYVGHAGIYPRPTRKEDWEFVYFLNQKFWGKGYATEVTRQRLRDGCSNLLLKN